LTPPSTISTNKKEVWVEFFLARLLREKGATVYSFHVRPREGRRQTFSTAGGEGDGVEPPYDACEAHALANAASARARELDPIRKSMSRKKASPRLEKAIEFVGDHEIQQMTKDIIRRARRRGISKSTLRRAIQEHGKGNTLPITP